MIDSPAHALIPGQLDVATHQARRHFDLECAASAGHS